MTTVNILGTEYKVIREPFKDKQTYVLQFKPSQHRNWRDSFG